MNLGTAHYLSVRGGGAAKNRGGGYVNFHVVSRGVAFNFDFAVGGGMLILLIIPINKPLPFHLIFQNVAGFLGAKPPRPPSISEYKVTNF